ncbi:MAG: hypothetical protein OEV66_08345 [Spirochaetia bacterium]|nr:hypothetical protein [Spirochaetia bacterium]
MLKISDTLAKALHDYSGLTDILGELNQFLNLIKIPVAGNIFAHYVKLKTVARICHMKEDEFIEYLSRKIGERAGCINPAGKKNQLKHDSDRGDELFKDVPETKLDMLYQKICNKDKNLTGELDVSELAPPEPLFQIMEYMNKKPAPLILFVRHRQKPMHLPPLLKNKDYLVSVYEKGDYIKIYIYSNLLLEEI